MSQPHEQTDFDQMSVAERILHLQDLWDRVADNPEAIELTEEQREELDRRLASHEQDPDAAIPWDEANQRLRNRR